VIDPKTRRKYIEEIALGIRESMNLSKLRYSDDESSSADESFDQIRKALEKAHNQLMLLKKKEPGWRPDDATEKEVLEATTPKVFYRIDQVSPELQIHIDRISVHLSGAKAACSDAKVSIRVHRDNHQKNGMYEWQRHVYRCTFNYFDGEKAAVVREAAFEIMVLLELEQPSDDAIKNWRAKLLRDSRKTATG
tara:strand:- start:253057 stop:253635 length:579 start_codon:yes stop_codon:yes gene_type:complete